MKFALRGASSAALLVGLFGGGAFAQQAPSTVTTNQAPVAQAPAAQAPDQVALPAEQQAGDRVVVTGSYIATSAENAPKPVEVYSADDLKDQGSPSASDFVRSLSVVASSGLGFGQSNPDVITGSGFSNVDMRGQGSNGSLVLFNGRRMASTNGGFGADINTIPTEALQTVEVLKDGASATYGAGAVGGVINFTTRRDIDAPQVNFETTLYDGSSSYKADFMTGWVGDASNFLLSLSHFHESPLEATERSFSTLPYAINPAAYSNTSTNPGRFAVVNPSVTNIYGATAAQLTGTNVSSVYDYRGGANLNYATLNPQGRSDCEAVGGYIYGDVDPGNDKSLSATPAVAGTLCGFNENLLNQLVSDQTLDKIYAEFNGDLSDSMEFHVDGMYSKSVTLAMVPPSVSASASAIDSSIGAYLVPRAVQVYASPTTGPNALNLPGVSSTLAGTVANPYMQDFLNRTGATTGANGGVIIPASAWRPFMFGGNPAYVGSTDGREQQTYDRERFMINVGLKGEFTDGGIFGFLSGIRYDYGLQYNQYKDDRVVPAIFRSRVQNALLGYGGATCMAQDRVATDYTSAESYSRTVGIQSDTAPGTNGCQWLNPFASSFSRSIATGAANPQYGGSAYDIPKELALWLTQEDRNSEQLTEAVTFDAVFTGEIPDSVFTLPGGNIGWALGTQMRANELRAAYWSENTQEQRMISQACAWPDLGNIDVANLVQYQGAAPVQNNRGCLSGNTGVYLASGIPGTTDTTPPDFLDSQTVAYFTELQFPVFDNLSLGASYRWESYNNDKISGGLYSVSGKYQVTDNIYIRASHGTNFRAEGALDETPGRVSTNTTTGAAATFGASFIIPTRTTVSSNLGLEDDKTTNIGVGVDYDIGEGRLRASVDFFEILVNGAFSTTSTTTILTNVFGSATAPQPGAGTSAVQANCSASLIQFVVFATGTCVQGVTTAANILNGGFIDLYSLNGQGFVTDGFDYSIDYSHPLFDGRFSAGLQATQNTAYKSKGYSVNGVVFQIDRDLLGGANTLTGVGSPSQEWRANATLRWANDQHSFNLRANYLSGVLDNRLTAFTPIVNNTGTANDVFSTYGVAAKPYLDYDFTYIWTAPFWQDLELRASVLNIFDKMPPAAQGSAGYFTGAGDPRGRRLEMSINKKF